MNSVDQCCKTVCIVTVLSSVCLTLIPKNRLSNAVKSFNALIITYSLIFSFSGIKADEIFFESEQITLAQDSETYIETHLLNSAEELIKSEVEKLLKDKNIQTTCEINIDYKESNLENLIIVIQGKYDEKAKEKIMTVLKEKYGTNTEIIFSG